MTGATILLSVLLWAEIVSELRMGADYPLPQVLPLCGGHPPDVYDLVGCCILLFFVFLLYAILSVPRASKDTQRRFRYTPLLVVASLLLAHYVRRNVKPSLHWSDLVHELNIPDPERLSQTCVLAVTCIAILAIAAIWHAR